MAKREYRITENSLKENIKSTINEFFNRDFMDRAASLGIKDPTEDSVLDEEELKEKCRQFVQKCNEFNVILKEFYGYIYGVEEDAENGVQGMKGAVNIMRHRNLFGARNYHDQYLESDLKYLADSLGDLQSAMQDTIECSETFV